MGAWSTAINGNDTFLDIYQNFFDLYNQGANIQDISKQIVDEFAEMFDDYDDRNNALFALALAQWETKSLDPKIFEQVKAIIESGIDLELWKGPGTTDRVLEKRKNILDKFLNQISLEKEKPKRRVKPKFEFSTVQLVKAVAPDGRKVFEASEEFVNGVYSQTGSAIFWESGGGGSVFYFEEQGRTVSARWVDSQTLEVIHDEKIVFTKKDDSFYYCGDQGKVIYVPAA
ncbi:hypothetical protein [Hymenobacter antarcticus]|uniref:DUF4259 domain-containing protein n=1 Tax=Hymenobacter antarcticus TaxID=486270 RepID=A0ABP7PYY0_9BACT